jgi:hypothetical protein
MDVGENRVRVFYGTEKREGERLDLYTEIFGESFDDSPLTTRHSESQATGYVTSDGMDAPSEQFNVLICSGLKCRLLIDPFSRLSVRVA